MTYQEQEQSGKFVAWGKKKAKENSYIVKQDKPEEFLVLDIKPSDKYGYIFEFQSKKSEEPLIAPGNGNLRRLMGYELQTNDKGDFINDQDGVPLLKEKQSVKKPVQIGDKVRITFLGMAKGKRGESYTYKIEVDR